jgi:hypothetical protein
MLLAAFLVLKPMIPIIEYVVNYEYISTVLCVNKDKPKMQCKGKCHLNKNLEKEFERDVPAPDKVNFLTEWIMLFLETAVPIDLRPVENVPVRLYGRVENIYRFNFHQDHFRPPALF